MFSSRILLVAGLLCGTAFGQIAYDSTGAPASSQGGATSFTFTDTVVSTSGGILIAACGGNVVPSSIRLGGTTCSNGTAFTIPANCTNTAATPKAMMGYVTSHAAGSNTIRCCYGSAPADAWAASVALTGVQAVEGCSNSNGTFSGSPATLSTTHTTTNDNAWVIDYWFVAVDPGAVPTATAPSTARQSKRDLSSGRGTGMSTQGPVSPAGSATMAWGGFTGVSGNPWVQIKMSLQPSGGAPAATTPRMTLLGVGP